MSTMVGINPQEESKVDQKMVETARAALKNYLGLIPEEGVLLLWAKKTADQKTLSILRAAVEAYGSDLQEVNLSIKKIGIVELTRLLENHKVVISLAESRTEAVKKLRNTEFLKKNKIRHWSLNNAPFWLFKSGGFLDEDPLVVKERLLKMEAVLRQGVGFRITTDYGTDLTIGMMPFGTRRWVGVTGEVKEPGRWDNPGAEIFTTPDEFETRGVLKLPVLDSEIDSAKVVDEWVELIFYNGRVVEIKGEKSARRLRNRLAQDAENEEKEGRDPSLVYQIAELAFGASKGIPVITNPKGEDKDLCIPTVLAEKSLDSMHFALGNSAHGEPGAEGRFLETVTHYDFVISNLGLTVEMFTNEDDFRELRNGRKIFSDGYTPEW